MRARFSSYALGFVIALSATALAVLARGALQPFLGTRAFLPFLYAAIAVSLWFGGYGPAIVSALAGYAAIVLLVLREPLVPAAPGPWISLVAYLGSCAILIVFGEAALRTRRRIEAQQRELDRETAALATTREALEASERRDHERRLELEALMESAPAAMWVAHDAHCRRITGNPATYAMLGLAPGTNLSRTASLEERTPEFEIFREGRRVDPDGLPMQTAARTATPVLDQELEFRFHDGRPPVWAYGNAVPLFDHQGEVRGAISTFIDITERRRVEALRRESEERFRTLADQAPVLIWLNDLDGCEFVNREYLRFLGRELERVRGMGWADALHPDDAAPYLAVYRRAMETRQPFEAQFRFRRADGEYRWMKSSGVPRLTADGSLLGFAGCSLDITDVKRALEALEEADRRKDEFLATLAHELRNPLAPLRSGLEILRLSLRADARSEATLAVMERQLGHMVRMVDDLVDVSRISRGKIGLHRERVDLTAIAAEAAAIAGERMREIGRELTVALPGEPIWVEGDPTRLAQVVANLLDNAAKYTEVAGRVRLSVERAGGGALLAVEDDGLGIPPEMLARVFDMFTQVERPLDRAHGGLGIGLTIVKRLVELHGGRVEASSRGERLGSRFAVHLPIAVAAGTGAPSPGARAGAAAAPPGHRILVVDDNEDAASSLAAVLRLLGYEVRAAGDGAAALEAAAAFRPELVLLDIGMPGMNGYEVCRRIRREPWGAGMAVVALTGWGQASDRQRARDAGFDHHLTKPMDPAVVAELLERPWAQGSARGTGGAP